MLVCLAACGCSAPLLRSVPEAELSRSERFDLIDGLSVPKVPGPDGCGAQALAAVLTRGQDAAAAEALADELPWHDLGATPIDLLLEARSRGFEATLARGSWEDLTSRVHDGVPVLAMLDVSMEVRTLLAAIPTPSVMHWSVVSGVARDGSSVVLGAPGGRHHVVGRDDFLRRWSRSDQCTIVVGRGEARRHGEENRRSPPPRAVADTPSPAF
jgi:predicted double-glycine peptidase